MWIHKLHRTAAQQRGVIGLAGGLPATELMPRAELADALAAVVRGTDDAVQYAWPEGAARLRAWVATRLGARGARVSADDVIITSGAQQALSLIGQALRGKRIAVGAATYPAAIAAFERAGAEVVSGTQMGSDPISYAMPGVANPEGRERLSGVPDGIVIADEAYTELRFDGRLPRPLIAEARDRVWHVGTLSKTLCPGLRVGWLVPPRGEVHDARERKEAADLQTASITMQAAARVLDRIDYDAHVERAREAYRERAEIMMHALRTYVPKAHFVPPEGGFSVWLELDDPDDGGDDIALLAAAVEGGVSFDPGSAFRPKDGGGPLALRVSYSAAPIDQLEEGVRRLGRVLDARASRRRS